MRLACAALAAVLLAGLLGGCQDAVTGSVRVNVGDQIDNWNNMLAVRLSGLFNLGVEPEQEGYEYIGVLIAVQNLSADTDYAIGAQNIWDIDAAYPVPPVENVSPYFRELVKATGDFAFACDGAPVTGGAYLYVYDELNNAFMDAPALPALRAGYIELVCLAPKGWRELEVTYTPAFAGGQTATFTMSASEMITADATTEDME